jgi:hypothetical protein
VDALRRALVVATASEGDASSFFVGNSSIIPLGNRLVRGGDFIFIAKGTHGFGADILGVSTTRLAPACASSSFALYWALSEGSPDQHCLPCGKS